MKTQFQNQSVGMTAESLAGKANTYFKPAIAFSEDDGASPVATAPEPAIATPPNPSPVTEPAEDVSGLKSALEKERKLRQDFEKRQKQIEEMFKGIDPEKYKELEKLQAQAEEMNQREVKLRTELENEWTQKVKEEQKKVEQIQAQYTELLTKTQVEKAFQESAGRNGGQDGITFFDAFYDIIKPRLRMSDRGHLEVIDANGARLFSSKDATKPMPLTEFFKTLHTHPVYGQFFGAREQSKGGGMSPGAATNYLSMNNSDLANLPPAERLAAIRERKAAM